MAPTSKTEPAKQVAIDILREASAVSPDLTNNTPRPSRRRRPNVVAPKAAFPQQPEPSWPSADT